MIKRNLFIGAVALLTAITAVNAFSQSNPLDPCPDCLPCTNCVFGTNSSLPPQEFPLNTLLVRVSVTSGFGALVMTNYPWVVDTNNLLVSGGFSSWNNANSDPFTVLQYNLTVTNTLPLRAYTVQFAPSLTGPWADVTPIFCGSTNSQEVTLVTFLNKTTYQAGFWRAKQQDGFVYYAYAFTNGFSGGAPSGCPGTYHGYINYVRTVAQGWGFIPDTNVLDHTVTDVREPTNHLQLVTDYGFIACNTNTVDWTNIPTLTPPLFGTAARATVYFKNYPTNQAYPVLFRGFLEPTNNIAPHLVGLPTPTFEIQPFTELDDIQQKAMGLSTNQLITSHDP